MIEHREFIDDFCIAFEFYCDSHGLNDREREHLLDEIARAVEEDLAPDAPRDNT